MTPVQKRQLESELAELEGPRRAEVVRAIATARSFGDLLVRPERPGLPEEGVDERRLAVIDVRDDRDVPQVVAPREG